MKRKIFIAAAIILGGVWLCYANNVSEFTRTGWNMNTVIRMTVYSQDDKAVNVAYDLLGELDAELSMYEPGSIISRINSHAGREKIHADSKVIEVIRDALKVYDLSNGVFNPLIGPVTRLWKINRADGKIPSHDELENAIALTDISNLELDDEGVYLKREGCVLDLGGIAKGYASKKIAGMLQAGGVKSGLIDLGGNVQVIGRKPNGDDWVIGVRDPSDARGNPALVLKVHDTAVITSGNYERYKIVDGKKYSHFFDVHTGDSVLNELLSATVITPDGSLADGLATAFMAQSFEKSLELAKSLDVGVIFIREEKESLSIIATENLEGMIVRSSYPVEILHRDQP